MSNYQLIKNTEWKEVEINGEDKEIPVDWKVKNISQVSFCWDNKRKPLNQTERSNKKGNIPYWGANNIVDYVNDYLVDEEVVLLGEDAAPFYDKTKKVAFVSNEKIWPNNHIHVLKPLINSYFLMTVLNAVQYEKIIGTDSRPKLTQGMMNSIEFSYPSENEQSAIASILSEQESVIENIEQLIQKYESRFQYLSDELLSGRLRVKEVNGEMVLYKNPDDNWKEVEINGEMKEIPSDWEVDKISKNIKFSIGNTPAKIDGNYNGSIPWITISNLIEKNINQYTAKIKKLSNVKLLPSGTLLGSFKMSVGKFGFTTQECATNEAIVAIKPNDTVNNINYLYYTLPSVFLDNAEPNGQGTLLLNTTKIKDLDYIVPTFNNQIKISLLLCEQEELINEQKQKLQKEKQKFDWLLDNLLSGNYLIKENNEI